MVKAKPNVESAPQVPTAVLPFSTSVARFCSRGAPRTQCVCVGNAAIGRTGEPHHHYHQPHAYTHTHTHTPQVHSYDMAKTLGILPGSRAVRIAELDAIHLDLILGIVLIEGSFPSGHLNPALGHFVHYAEYTKFLGPLIKYWMMAFERYIRFALAHTQTFALTHTHTLQPSRSHTTGTINISRAWFTTHNTRK